MRSGGGGLLSWAGLGRWEVVWPEMWSGVEGDVWLGRDVAWGGTWTCGQRKLPHNTLFHEIPYVLQGGSS